MLWLPLLCLVVHRDHGTDPLIYRGGVRARMAYELDRATNDVRIGSMTVQWYVVTVT